MFSEKQIHGAHAKVKSGADFPRFIQDLKAIGVTSYDTFVADGSSVYFGANDYELKTSAKYPALVVNDESSSDALKEAIRIHQQGQTDYPTFCKQASEAGVNKWTTHMLDMSVSYLNKKGDLMLLEPIPGV